MSCTAPVNITYVSNKCDSKCDYRADYSDSVCVATKMSNYIACKYDTNSAQTVTYNTVSYYVYEIRIYSPSLHTYDGWYASGEIIIMHKTSTTQNVLVCIPIATTSPATNVNKVASQNLSDIINATATCDGDCEVTFSGTNSMFNLNNFIPVGVPFFSYNGTFPWCESSVGNVNYVVFDPGSFTVACSQTQLSLIPQNTYAITTTPPALFINSVGVNKNVSNNVYIDCVPVETSTDETTMYANASAMPTTLSLPTIDMTTMWKILTTFTVIIIIILLIIAYYKFVGLFKTDTK